MKEIWIQAYETAIERICDEQDVDMDEGERLLQKILDKEPGYLTDYFGCYEG